jgi:hypothetical protein
LAVLNKQLVFDHIRLTKETAVFIENDAASCFDRIVNLLVLLFLLHLGVSKTIVSSLAKSWESTVHHIHTVYGISTEGHSNEANSLLFGPGQGATLGPFLWILCFILISMFIPAKVPCLHHTSVDQSVSVSHLGQSFVDDTNLGCSEVSLSPNTCQHNMHPQLQFNTALKWECLLYSTSGALNLEKSFWFSLSWT